MKKTKNDNLEKIVSSEIQEDAKTSFKINISKDKRPSFIEKVVFRLNHLYVIGSVGFFEGYVLSLPIFFHYFPPDTVKDYTAALLLIGPCSGLLTRKFYAYIGSKIRKSSPLYEEKIKKSEDFYYKVVRDENKNHHSSI